MLRIPKYPAGTLWLWTVAAPSSLPAGQLKVPLGCAPGFPAGYQGLLIILPKPPPEEAHPLSRLLFVSVTKTSSIWLYYVKAT